MERVRVRGEAGGKEGEVGRMGGGGKEGEVGRIGGEGRIG